ncbi:MAG: sugar phosphate nucleotidyltransferase [Anaerolineae bacterium]|jgi:UTP--glucose-1-phosphate uridylyltransferase
MERVTDKAIIPAAGLGQRLRPITSVVPKEMFPIGRHPAIEWVIAEAVASGCTDIAVVISPRKRIIKEYLTTCCSDLLKLCRLNFLIQTEPLGLGHALLLAREFCAQSPFALLFPDLMVDCPQLPLLQVSETFKTVGGIVFSMVRVKAESAAQYAHFQMRHVGERVYKIKAISARTTLARSPSLLVGAGRNLWSPECLDYAEMLLDQPRTGELDDGIILQHLLAAGEPVHGVHIEGQSMDISTPDGYVAAWQRLGKEPILNFLKER